MKQPSVGANLSDVAARGVSVASASRVLSGSKYPVSDKVRKKVLAAAKELRAQYFRPAPAQQFQRAIGIIIAVPANPFYNQVVFRYRVRRHGERA